MARTLRIVPFTRSAEGKRPVPINRTSLADLRGTYAAALGDNEIIILPEEYDTEGKEDPDDLEFDAHDATCNISRCRQATLAYRKLGEPHPMVVPLRRPDPWTGFPVLARPPGPQLAQYIRDRKSALYSAPTDTDILSSRILPAYRRWICEWALDLISALAFVHSKEVTFGILTQEHCWLSADPDAIARLPGQTRRRATLSLFGFVDAEFPAPDGIGAPSYAINAPFGGNWINSVYYPEVDGERTINPTKMSDLLLFGCMVYELMVGIDYRNDDGRYGAAAAKVVNAQISGTPWPTLEAEYMGDIVGKCWRRKFESAEEVRGAVLEFLREHDGQEGGV